MTTRMSGKSTPNPNAFVAAITRLLPSIPSSFWPSLLDHPHCGGKLDIPMLPLSQWSAQHCCHIPQSCWVLHIGPISSSPPRILLQLYLPQPLALDIEYFDGLWGHGTYAHIPGGYALPWKTHPRPLVVMWPSKISTASPIAPSLLLMLSTWVENLGHCPKPHDIRL